MTFIHQTAEIDKTAKIGKNSKIWHFALIREGVVLGKNCIIGKGVYIDHDVVIGDNCKIQNHVSIYFQTLIEKNVFIGPNACFTNDKIPRATSPVGKQKNKNDWKSEKIIIKEGASIGAGSIILPGITIGKWAMIGAGSLVSKNVPDYGLVYGSPAMTKGYVCPCGLKLIQKKSLLVCLKCDFKLKT